MARYTPKYSGAAKTKISTVMHEFGKGMLHSGSKHGPIGKDPKQAIAVAISVARKRGMKVPSK